MRIRVPLQLIIFALVAAFAMAVPGLPRRHFDPPSMVAGLGFSSTQGAPGWGDRIRSHFPVGSSSDDMVRELRRQGFEVGIRDELSRGGRIVEAGYYWPYADAQRLNPFVAEECIWILDIFAETDANSVIQSTRGELRLTCSDTVQFWAV